MSSLTSRQYSLLKILLEAKTPLSTTALGRKTSLTSRQINYDLQGMQHYLGKYGLLIRTRPGIGVVLECSPEQRQLLMRELGSEKQVQLILTIGERCQMLALLLLASDTSMILAQMQQLASEFTNPIPVPKLTPVSSPCSGFH